MAFPGTHRVGRNASAFSKAYEMHRHFTDKICKGVTFSTRGMESSNIKLDQSVIPKKRSSSLCNPFL